MQIIYYNSHTIIVMSNNINIITVITIIVIVLGTNGVLSVPL